MESKNKQDQLIGLQGESKYHMQLAKELEKDHIRAEFFKELQEKYYMIPKKKYVAYKVPSNRVVGFTWKECKDDSYYLIVLKGEVYRVDIKDKCITHMADTDIFLGGAFENVKDQPVNTIYFEEGVGTIYSFDSTEIISYNVIGEPKDDIT